MGLHSRANYMRRQKSTTFLLPLLAIALLSLLATLQYRWLGQVNSTEAERMKTSLDFAVKHFCRDFDRELADAVVHHVVNPELGRAERAREYANRFSSWNEDDARLIRGVISLYWDEQGKPQALRLDLESATFLPQPTRELLADLGLHDDALLEPETLWMRAPLVEEIAAVVVGAGRAQDPHFDLLLLDQEIMRNNLLPSLAQRYFARGEELDYDLWIRSLGSDSTLVYASRSAAAPMVEDAIDARGMLFRFHPGGEGIRTHMRRFFREGGRQYRGARGRRGPPFAEMGKAHWELLATHRDGSLEAAVASVRHKNIAISAGILALLGATIGMMWLATRRAQQLAAQQIEFVAAISHELRTPIATISSAAGNLADGVIRAGPQVAEYGALIQREGRRLASLVGQVLSFGKLSAGDREQGLERVSLVALLEETIQACLPEFEEAGFRLQRDLPAQLPEVRANRADLRGALDNLLQNALKHAHTGAWVRVAACSEGRQVMVSVEDKGPGINPADRPHIFEPFYRGRDLAESPVPGTGLGLTIVKRAVEAGGGSVRVDCPESGGTRFELRFPIAPAGEKP